MIFTLSIVLGWVAKIELITSLSFFDEILVNSRDCSIEDDTCDQIKIDINQEENTISVFNNVKGIDIVIHSEHKMLIP